MLRSNLLGGGNRVRTGDPLLAKQVLYQLSYTPAAHRISAEMLFASQKDAPSGWNLVPPGCPLLLCEADI